jgi:hypothetical protein
MPSDGNCFLCENPEDLIYAQSPDAFALCGLGPLTAGYTVVGTRSHAASAADVNRAVPGFTRFAEEIRSFLTTQYGSCLLTEHGRMPVCIGPTGAHDAHCFHAHFLLFPAAPAILDHARKFFRSAYETSSLAEALNHAEGQEEYMLLSPNATSACVLTRPGKLIPQFARMLVADALGISDQTNWKANPNRETAVKTAVELRAKLKELYI